MYNRLYKHLLNNNVLHKKQFGFQENHSTDHAFIQLVDQISNSFEKNRFTFGVFVDLSKAVDHVIFLKLVFTPCKAKQPLQDMELQEKETQKN